MQMVDASDGLIIECDYQIALVQISSFGGTIFLDRNNEDGRLERQAIKSYDPPMNRHVLPGHADVTTPDAPIANEPSRNQSGSVTCDRETDVLRRSNHCRVY